MPLAAFRAGNVAFTNASKRGARHGFATRATSDGCGRHELAQQEVERRAVEGLRVLVQPGVRQVLEDHQLAFADPALEPLGETRGADEVVRPDGDQARNADLAEHRACVVRDGRLGLGQERVQRLGRAASHELRVSVSTNSGRLTYISGVKQKGKMPWMTTSAAVGSDDASVRHSSTTVVR